MKKSQKLVSLIVAAVMAFGMIVAPVEALAVGATSLGQKKWGNFQITNVKKPQIVLKNLTKSGKKKKSITIKASYKLQKNKFTDTKTSYKVVGIKKGAFKGSNAKVIKIKASFAPKKAAGMLKRTKAKKVTIKVPKKQVKAWKKYAKKGKLGLSGKKVTIKKL